MRLSSADVCEGADYVTVVVLLESAIESDVHLRLDTVDGSAEGS